MSQAADAEYGDEIARPRAAVAQGVEGRDSGAEQRGGFRRRQFVGNCRQGFEGSDHVLRVAPVIGDARNLAGGKREVGNLALLGQCPPCQPTPTRAPAFHSGTSLPTASNRPTTSCPGTLGNLIPGNAPCLVKESLWQMPHACTLIRTCRGPGVGRSRTTSSRGPLARET